MIKLDDMIYDISMRIESFKDVPYQRVNIKISAVDSKNKTFEVGNLIGYSLPIPDTCNLANEIREELWLAGDGISFNATAAGNDIAKLHDNTIYANFGERPFYIEKIEILPNYRCMGVCNRLLGNLPLLLRDCGFLPEDAAIYFTIESIDDKARFEKLLALNPYIKHVEKTNTYWLTENWFQACDHNLKADYQSIVGWKEKAYVLGKEIATYVHEYDNIAIVLHKGTMAEPPMVTYWVSADRRHWDKVSEDYSISYLPNLDTKEDILKELKERLEDTWNI